MAKMTFDIEVSDDIAAKYEADGFRLPKAGETYLCDDRDEAWVADRDFQSVRKLMLRKIVTYRTPTKGDEGREIQLLVGPGWDDHTPRRYVGTLLNGDVVYEFGNLIHRTKAAKVRIPCE